MKDHILNKKINVSGLLHPVGTGWLSPLPDLRDYTDDHAKIRAFSRKLGLSAKKHTQQALVDLRQWCSPVEDQLDLGSCTANAGVGVVEYFERRAYGKHIEASRLFLYKATRNLMQVTGDTGAWLRSTMGALVLCGVPAEKYWPYNVTDFDKEPGSFVYSLADNYETVKYFCHDPQGSDLPSAKVLSSVKKYLEAGIPSMFGFWGFQSFEDSDNPGDIPYPCNGESAQWGHAVVAVGYDDNRKIKNTKCNKETRGALLIRNSWGTSWGDKGYGWLPYDYVLNRLALDFWSLLEMGWIDSGEFGI
jgi:C1A family cysteine protease